MYAKIIIMIASIFLIDIGAASAQQTLRVVSWNAEATLFETLERRRDEIRAMDSALSPDILVLIEIAGLPEAHLIANHLGWPQYYLAVSDFSDARQQVFEGLEVAVISKTPIVAALEHDTSPDGVHDVVGPFGSLAVAETKLSSEGISGIDTTGANDRGTLRVDLENGLTIFPVHLKASTNSQCSDLASALGTLRSFGQASPLLQNLYDHGFDKATQTHRSNAAQRERVVAAVKLLADGAIAQGRTVVIAGDFNTSFEPGKAGTSLQDCTLANFSCALAPFPASACQSGDGFDDTLGILEESLVGTDKWRVLSRGLGKTYKSDFFADLAIDHIAVPATQAEQFTPAQKSTETIGSDHFAVWTEWTKP